MRMIWRVEIGYRSYDFSGDQAACAFAENAKLYANQKDDIYIRLLDIDEIKESEDD